ncbi:hypothetical protein K7472_30390 [Streptomyces sp. PTM05]|uniref:SWIM-type domain-containing protein n=1 Tax=Streptantibioticus parmotrematis TaxID=2873249 RepID=A0ABS7R0X7_9ACTN|nr:hypothetical protein [Streptantibioticus parmotrematis]MBY8889122.1 hypothetical protein [Streptantibioticus parmotrematis]
MTLRPSTAGWAHGLAATLLSQAVHDTTLWTTARHLAADGTAGPLNINKGSATVKFFLPDGRHCRPRLVVTELTDTDWDRVEAAITARPDAAELAGTNAISDQFADPAATGGIPILPTAHDISHTCDCTPTAAASPCPHSLAVGLLLADRIRTAPAPLFTLRGRPHQNLKNRLRNSPPPPGPGTLHSAAPVIPATRHPHASTPPEPEALPTVAIPEPVDLDLTSAQPALQPAKLTPPPAPLPHLDQLTLLAADTAHRAARLLDQGEPPLCEDPAGDLARFTSLPHGADYRQTAMDHLGLAAIDMGHLQLAYTYGGPGGTAAYLEPFHLEHDALADAQTAIQPHRPAPTAPIEYAENRLTDRAAGVQLRYGPDGRWHPYRAPYGPWRPVPGPSSDPAQAYRAARTAARNNLARKGRTAR